MLWPLYVQFSQPQTAAAAWAFVQANFDALDARLDSGSARLVSLSANLCTPEAATEVEAFWGSRIDAIPGGPRNLAGALESIRLCAARVENYREGANTTF